MRPGAPAPREGDIRPVQGIARSTYRAVRKATIPLRGQLRSLRGYASVQRTVPLRGDDRVPRRRRRHVLVDLIQLYAPSQSPLVAELGSAGGATSAHLIRYCPQIERIYTIDIEKPEPGRDAIDGVDRVEFVHSTSVAAAEMFPDKMFDLVFVDADHSARAVFADLEAWEPKVKPGGVLSGHDYGSHNHPGVKPAVDFFFALRSKGPVQVDADKVWWTIK